MLYLNGWAPPCENDNNNNDDKNNKSHIEVMIQPTL